MTLNKQVRLVSSARISEIANGANLIMGEKEWLANTAIYLANELKTATKAFQAAGFAQLEVEEKLEAAERHIAELQTSLVISDLKDASQYQKRIDELEAREVLLPEVRITIAESKLRNMNYRELNAHNSGAVEAAEKISKTLTAAGIKIKGE